jgi:hypothetical protein
MGLLVGLLRKKNEIAAMVVGVLTETIIFFVVDAFVFGVAFALITLGTLADLIFVPVGYGILKAVRKILKITYLG